MIQYTTKENMKNGTPIVSEKLEPAPYTQDKNLGYVAIPEEHAMKM